MLLKMEGKKLAIRPVARRYDEQGRELDAADDAWLVQEVSRSRVVFLNPRTAHVLPLGTDHVREYLTDASGRTDGFLILKSQVIIQTTGISVEPLSDTGALLHSPSRVSRQLLEELDEGLRLAKGIVIEGPPPLYELASDTYTGIGVSGFVAHIRSRVGPVGYNSGSISGLAKNTIYYVYGIDADRRGGAVTYLATPLRHNALIGDEKVYIGRLRTRNLQH
jgi:hypothetical protein